MTAKVLPDTPPSAAPPRTLGLATCLALVVGNMIGSGVFLLPASLAPYGWSALGGWAITIAGTLCLAAAFSALARAFPRAGGPYAYVEEAFGSEAAFIVAWSYWVGLWVGNAALAVAFVSNLSTLVPAIAEQAGLGAGLALATVWLLTLINMRGVRAGGLVAMVTTVLKLLPLIAVILIAAVVLGKGGAAAVVTPPTGLNLSAVTATVTLTMWAMLGFEAATLPADKVRDPARTIPRATMVGTAATGLIYLVVCTAMLLLVPAGSLAASNSPFADFARPFVGPVAASAIALFAAIAALGALNGWILVQAEMPRAMAEGGVFPRWFAGLAANGTPTNALIASSGLMTVLVLANFSKSMNALFVFTILISTAAMLVAYLAVALAALKLRHAGRLPGPAWLVPVAGLGAAYSAFAILAAGREAVGWGAVLLAAGVPILWAVRKKA
jgi:APA family basic amino acid/polyamine antiporter